MQAYFPCVNVVNTVYARSLLNYENTSDVISPEVFGFLKEGVMK